MTLQRLRTRTTPARDEIDQLTGKLATRLGIARTIRVLESALAKTPMVIGFFKPIILIPASAITSLSISELESILAHELAHIRRHDYLVNLLQAVAETVLFYHPAVWIISRELRQVREECCDDLALSITRDRKTYATALAAVASVRVTSLAPAASSGKLLPRLRRILQLPEAEASNGSRWIVSACIAFIIALGTLAPRLQSSTKAASTQPAADDIVHVHGRVLLPDGKPAAGATVTAAPTWPYGQEEGLPTTVAKAAAGSDGRFELSFRKSDASRFNMGYRMSGADLWKKTNIVASVEGFGLDWQQYDHVDAVGDVQLKLVRDVPVQGRLVDLEGNPASGVTVTVKGIASHILTENAQFQHLPENFRGLNTPLADRTFVSDADGRFTITGLGEERRVTLGFSSEKFYSIDDWVLTREGKTLTSSTGQKFDAAKFELAVSLAGVVTGVVRDAETHEPIAGAIVETEYSIIHLKTHTDAQGRYRLAGLSRGGPQTQLIAKPTDQPYVPAIVSVPKQNGFAPATVDLEMFKGVWITGKVVDKNTGHPVPAAVNYLPYAANKYSGKNPLFRLGYANPPCNADVAPDGTYRLVAHSGPGIVAVRVPQSNYVLGQGFDAVKDKDRLGRVRSYFPGLVSPTFYNAVQEIDPQPGAAVSDMNFELDPGRTIHIACTDPDGKPLDKISVLGDTSAVISGGNPGSYTGGKFDAISFTADEKRMIVVRDEQRELGKIVLVKLSDATEGKLTIKLEPAGKLTGRLLNSQGDPIKQGAMRVETYIPELKERNRTLVMPRADDGGRFTLQVPPGTRLFFGASASRYGGDFKVISDNITLKPGETKELGDLTINEKDVLK